MENWRISGCLTNFPSYAANVVSASILYQDTGGTPYLFKQTWLLIPKFIPWALAIQAPSLHTFFMNTWIKYTGEYKQQYYDLKLKTGRLVTHCWPYKGTFNPVNRSNEWAIESWRVEEIRVSEMQKNFPLTSGEE